MTKNEFKQGDRVRSKVALYSIPAGLSGVITAIMPDGRYKVRIDGEAEWHGWYEGKDLELIESFDRRTAFLTRLQSLLREFDAAIEPEYSSYSEAGIVSIVVGSECVVESYDTITADNIMDFDAELLVKCSEALTADLKARNSMGCSENWYNPYWAIAHTFSSKEISEFTPQEIDNLIRLAECIADGLY